MVVNLMLHLVQRRGSCTSHLISPPCIPIPNVSVVSVAIMILAQRGGANKPMFARRRLVPAGRYCFLGAKDVDLSVCCPSRKMVRFTTNKDDDVPRLSLYHPVTFLTSKRPKIKVKDAKMPKSPFGRNCEATGLICVNQNVPRWSLHVGHDRSKGRKNADIFQEQTIIFQFNSAMFFLPRTADFVAVIMPPTCREGGIKHCFYPSVRPSVSYIANNSRTRRPNVAKFGKKVPSPA